MSLKDTLKKLENSKYLIQDEYKQYYSELTGIVRSYLEEDVHVSALESTTDQLIEKLEMLNRLYYRVYRIMHLQEIQEK